MVCLIMLILKNTELGFLGGDDSRTNHLSRLLAGENIDENLENYTLDGTAGREMQEAAVDSFEELFQHMCSMKSQASALEGAERKAFAEKVTMAFWKAIEGDEAEIEGLSSPDEE